MKKLLILIPISFILLLINYFLCEYSPKCLPSEQVILKLDNWNFKKDKGPIPDEIMKQAYPVHNQTGEKLYKKWEKCYITEKQKNTDAIFKGIANFLGIMIYMLWAISGIIIISTLFKFCRKHKDKIKEISKKAFTKEFLIKLVLTLLSIYLIILIVEKIFNL